MPPLTRTSRPHHRLVAWGLPLCVVVAAGCAGDDTDAASGTTTTTAGTASTTTTGDPGEGGADGGTGASTTTTSRAPGGGADVPVVVGGWLLGWWDGAGWVPAPETAGQAAPDPSRYPLADTWALAAVDSPVVTVEASQLREGCFRGAEVPQLVGDRLANGVGVPVGTDAFPRPVDTIAPLEEHVADIAAFLDANGIGDEPVEIDRVLRFDADGDGVDEVLVEASHGDVELGLSTDEGDYSVITYRRVAPGGAVDTVVVASDVTTAEEAAQATGTSQVIIEHHRVMGLVDANEDGTFELALSSSAFESRTVRFVDTAGPTRTIFDAGCGS